MTCHGIPGVGIVCFGHTRRAGCSVGNCRRPHTRLCDFPLGAGRTCDQKICDQHAAQVDGADYCPFHAGQPRLQLGGAR